MCQSPKHPSITQLFVSTSIDGGQHGRYNPTSASIPVDDREWIAADRSKKSGISYHAYATTNNIIVDCSYNAGFTFTQHASAFEPTKCHF